MLTIDIPAQLGGLFPHVASGESDRPTVGARVTTVGALMLVAAVLSLLFAWIAQSPG